MIRWITKNLGTAAWDVMIQAPPECVLLDVRDMVDKGGNAPAVVKAKIDEALESLRRGRKVVVCCDYGMSRSNAIAAGILAAGEKIDLSHAIGRVVEATGEGQIRIEVLAAVRQALGENAKSMRPAAALGRRILVTGASGFIGSSLLARLRATNLVLAPAHQEINLMRDIVALDLEVKKEDVDTLIHLANPKVLTSAESLGNTLTMLKNALDICAENRLFLVYLSGWEIYSGYESQELRADEMLAAFPGGTYGETKLLCELLIAQYCRSRGIECLILRPSPVYGPHGDRPKFIWNFLEKARQNWEIVTHRYQNGFPRLDLLHVDDLCSAIVAAIERHEPGVFNLGTGIGTSTCEIARLIVERIGSRSSIRHHDIQAYASNIVMDSHRAADLLRWRPTIDIAQGLETIIEAKETEDQPL